MEQQALPLQSGKELGDAGIAKVESHNLEWKDRALTMVWELRAYRHGADVTGEDIKVMLRGMGLDEPLHHNGWSMLTRRCVDIGILSRTNKTARMNLPSAHGRTNPIWKFT